MRRYVFALLLTIFSVSVAAQDSVTGVMLNEINRVRIENNLATVAWNPQLAQAAQRHSIDMAQAGKLSHVGSDGSQFWERIEATGYDLAAGAENVLSRSSLDPTSAVAQWLASPPHAANILNTTYSEAGVAYHLDANGIVYFAVVLAQGRGETNQTSVVQTHTLQPTLTPTHIQEPTTAPSPTQIAQPTRTLMPTDAVLATIIAPLPTVAATQQSGFATVVPAVGIIPTEAPPDIRLVYTAESFSLINISGNALNLSNLRFDSRSASFSIDEWNTSFLSQPLSSFTSGDCLQAWPVLQPDQTKPAACRFRHAWIALPDSAVFWQNASFFTVRNGTTPVGICEIGAGQCEMNVSTPLNTLNLPDTTSPPVDLRLVYNQSNFALVNVSGHSLNLYGLVFRSDEGVFSSERWNTEFLTQPLHTFSAGGCLQIWELGASNLYDPPEECAARHAWIAVGEEFDFWHEAQQFIVEYQGVRVGLCEVRQGICEVSLSDDFGSITSNTAPLQTSAPPRSTYPSDLRLLVSEQSVTLLNTSGVMLDVSNLAFESDNGVFVASRWDTSDLSRPLTSLPSGDCLQIWPVLTEWQPAPAECAIRHAWVAVRPEEQFWRDARVFRVRLGADVLATCEARSPYCDVDLP